MVCQRAVFIWYGYERKKITNDQQVIVVEGDLSLAITAERLGPSDLWLTPRVAFQVVIHDFPKGKETMSTGSKHCRIKLVAVHMINPSSQPREMMFTSIAWIRFPYNFPIHLGHLSNTLIVNWTSTPCQTLCPTFGSIEIGDTRNSSRLSSKKKL